MPGWFSNPISLFFIGLLLMNRVVSQSPTQSNTRSAPVDFQTPIERNLKGGEKHTYPLKLTANDFLKLVVEQRGIDVVVRLLGPDGKMIQEVDSPNGTQGPEPVSYIAETSGVFTVEIESLEKTAVPGTYEIKSEKVMPATEADQAQIEVRNFIAQATQLRQTGQYDQALPLAQQAVEKSEKSLGSEHALLADSLTLVGVLLFQKGDYSEVEPPLNRALAIREKILGPDHPDVATSLNILGVVVNNKGDQTRAEQLYQRSLAIRSKTFGPDHPDTANSLNNLAGLWLAKGDFQQAEPAFRRCLGIREKALGPNHPAVANTLSSLAFLLSGKGDLAGAEPLYIRALAIREKVFGPHHPDVAVSLHNLGDLYHSKGDYTQAESYTRRSLAISEQILGPNHPTVADSLNNLAKVFFSKSDYNQAEQYYARSLAIREKVFGPNHPIVAQSLINQARMLRDKGDYVQAEVLLRRSLSIQEKALGPEDPEFARTMNNLGELYRLKGDFAQAEPLLLKALKIREQVLGTTNVDVADSLAALAGLYNHRGDYAQAVPLFQRCLAIQEKVLGPDHPTVAITLNNLAGLYHSRGEYALAEPLYQRSLAISEKVFGPDHPDAATSLNNLALLYHAMGNYLQAEPLYARSQVLTEKAFGPDHPNVAANLNNLSRLFQVKGDVNQAIAYQARSNEASERDLIRNLVSGSERQKLLYLNLTTHYLFHTFSLQAQMSSPGQAARQTALTAVLRRKGRSLDAIASSIETLRHQVNPDTQKLLDEYSSLAGQISAVTLRGPSQQSPAEHLARLGVLEKQKEKLENEISLYSKEFRAQTAPITLEEVQKQIPADAVLLEYTRYLPYDPKTDTYGVPRYVVNSLDHQGNISVADLGEAKLIDQHLATFRKVIGTSRANLETEVQPASQALDRLVMKPIRALVGKATHLLISPDGNLSLIPFAALMDEKGKFLVENYRITYLTSGRDLLRLAVKIENHNPPLIMADPDYSIGKGPVLAGKQYVPLTRLVGTKMEGLSLKNLFPDADLKMQAEATKQALKSVQRPQILHIATHGRFLEDNPQPLLQGEPRTLVPAGPASATEKLKVENPLLRSWLFFAGANRDGNDQSDGTLTALEAAQLDLWGTKLVVLSACETGVGEAKTGDGVYGLRRALVLAGSESQLMSLWSISDRATRELMIEYYTRLKAGEGRSDALRNVQLKMLTDPKRRHPFFWASFIQSGEWANLAGVRKE